jgi:hypothetical protein
MTNALAFGLLEFELTPSVVREGRGGGEELGFRGRE